MVASMNAVVIYLALALVTICAAQIPDASHQWARPVSGDSRGPCPALNTLANHGYLPRNGKHLSVDQIASSVMTVFNIEERFVRNLATPAYLQIAGARGRFIDLEQLVRPGLVHNASLTRPDYGRGYSPVVVPRMVDALLADSSVDYLHIRSVACTRIRRERESAEVSHVPAPRKGPTKMNFTEMVPFGEAALLLLSMNGTEQGSITQAVRRDYGWPMVPKSVYRTWLLDERLPNGFKRAPTQITANLTTNLSTLLASYRELFFNGDPRLSKECRAEPRG